MITEPAIGVAVTTRMPIIEALFQSQTDTQVVGKKRQNFAILTGLSVRYIF
jgi:hypothetical protein